MTVPLDTVKPAPMPWRYIPPLVLMIPPDNTSMRFDVVTTPSLLSPVRIVVLPVMVTTPPFSTVILLPDPVLPAQTINDETSSPPETCNTLPHEFVL